MMIKYPFRVIIYKRNAIVPEQHSFEDITSAIVCRERALRKGMTQKVEILMTLDEQAASTMEARVGT